MYSQTNCISTANNTKLTLCTGATGCTPVSLQVPHLKRTSDYIVRAKPYNPYPYTTPTGLEDPFFLYTDNGSSHVIGLPFYFCFYDSSYNQLTLSANGILTFDTIHYGFNCIVNAAISYPVPTSAGVPCNGGQYVPRASIMPLYTDLDARNGFQQPSAPDRKIEYRIEGTAPCRRFIASYYKIGSWGRWGDGASCWPNGQATFQAVLYESSGLVDVNIETYTCTPIYSSNGKAILGMQNWAQNKGIAAPGKNCTAWVAAQESYQFIPSGGTSRFISSKLYTLSGALVQTADTASTTNGMLNLNFATVCPTADTTKYIALTSFAACPTGNTITYTDTVIVIRTLNTVNATATTIASCGADGGITVTATGGTGFTYSLNNGTPQASNTFTNLAAGSYTVTATSNTGCSKSINVTIPNSTVNVLARTDTAICLGNALVLSTTSNATNYNWQPTTGLSNAAIANPTATPTTTTTYIVTATKGTCIAKDTVTITVLPKPTVYAGADVTIISGDNAQLDAVVTNANQYLWSPTTYLSNATILTPLVTQPLSTVLYKLTATAPNGCTQTDEVLVTVLPYCIQPKNAFTPNGDGINDNWQVYTNFNCLQRVAVQVYNRYGNLVYRNTNYTNNWNGTYNNKALPDGTYYYVIDYTLVTGRVYTTKGDVTILR